MNISGSISVPVSASQAISRPATPAGEKQATKPNEQQQTETDFNKAQIASTLSEQELKQVQELKTRDREVRAHEAAHLAAAGSLAIGGASYSYQRGPDGVQYAVGGEVNIDTSAVAGDPEATLEKAQRIRSAALAPAQPSSQDLSVAAQAAQLAVQARAEIGQQQRTEAEDTTSDSTEKTDDETDSSVSSPQSESSNSTTTERQAQIIADNGKAVNDTPEAILDLIA
jgi:hypothetical protein